MGTASYGTAAKRVNRDPWMVFAGLRFFSPSPKAETTQV